jgi:hypothetical protein
VIETVSSFFKRSVFISQPGALRRVCVIPGMFALKVDVIERDTPF